MSIRINFSDEDRSTEGKSGVYDALPTGDYECVISDIELKDVKNGANQGKQMFKVELTVENNENDSYNRRKFWCNVMLFQIESGNWFLAQFLKATGNADALTTGVIPEADAYLGKTVTAVVKRLKNDYAMKDLPEGSPVIYKNEVKGFVTVPVEAGVGTKTTARGRKSSLLP